MFRKIAAVLMVSALSVVAMTGCADKVKESSVPEEITTEAETEAETETTEATPVTAEDYSYGLDEYGYVKDVKALDYITLPDFATWEFALSDIEVTDEAIDTDLDNIMEAFFTEQDTEKVIEAGDLVNFDYVGSVDGVEFDGGSAKGTDKTAGSSEFVDDFLTQIIGHKPGENFDIEVTFPENYGNTDLAGKDAIFNITINYVTVTPELTDEWLIKNKDSFVENTGVSDCSSVEAVRQFIYDYYYDYNLSTALSAKIAEVEVKEIPEKFYDSVYHSIDAQIYAYNGQHLSDLAESEGEDMIVETINEQSATILLYQAIAEEQGWKFVEADLEELTGTTDNSTYIETYGMGYMMQSIIANRAIEYISEQVSVK